MDRIVVPTAALAVAVVDGLLLWLSEEGWGYGPRSSHFNGVQAGHHAAGQRRFRLTGAADLLPKGPGLANTPGSPEKAK